MAIMLMVAHTTFTVKDTQVVGSDGHFTLIVEDMDDNCYFISDESAFDDAMGDMMKQYINLYKVNTTHTVDIDPLHNILTIG